MIGANIGVQWLAEQTERSFSALHNKTELSLLKYMFLKFLFDPVIFKAEFWLYKLIILMIFKLCFQMNSKTISSIPVMELSIGTAGECRIPTIRNMIA